MLKFSRNYSLSQVTTLGIGGPAKLYVVVKTPTELMTAIHYARNHQLPYLIIGGGSNLLVNDNGINCLIIKNEISGIEHHGQAVVVKSGTILQNLIDDTIHHGLAGLHKLTGIPGTVGGAVYGNAGAYGQTISDHLTEVVVYDSDQVVTLSKAQCDFNYRDSGFKRNKFTILKIKFQLESSDPQTLRQEAQDVLSKRLIKYPPGIKCPGSFFKNLIVDDLPQKILSKIPSDKITYGKLSAGYLLEAVGAQGQKLDGIEIANYHANLFINKGGGSAQAFYTLAKTYADKVKQKFGITLAPEVQLINLPPLN